MISRFLPYGTQYIDRFDRNEILKVLSSKFITQGPEIKNLKIYLQEYVGSKYAIACASGTAALHLSCLALGINSNLK